MTNERFGAFKRLTLKGQRLPVDLEKLWVMQATRGPDTNPLAKIGARLIEPGMDVALLRSVAEKDRSDPDTMAHIAAIEDVFTLSTIVAELDDQDLLGYWHGPEGTPIDKAPILHLDTEGQFEIATGRTLTEAIVAFHFWCDSDFARYRDWCAQLGIVVAARTLSELDYGAITSHPRDVHLEAYNRHRVAAGLPPFEDPRSWSR
jgi:hypothetical protein